MSRRATRRDRERLYPGQLQAVVGGAVDPIVALGPYSWAEADYYAIDGVSGKLLALLEKVPAGTGILALAPTHTWEQPNPTYQPAAPAAVPEWGGALGVLGSTATGLMSNAPKALWKGAHDGTGWTTIALLRVFGSSIHVLFSDVASPLEGQHIYFNGGTLSNVVYGTTGQVTGGSAASFPPGTSRVIVSRNGLAATPQFTVQQNTQPMTTAAFTGAPSLADPERPMWIMAQDSGSLVPAFSLEGQFAAILFFNRYLSDAEAAIVVDYLSAKYAPPADVFVALGFERVYRAQDAVTSGAITESIPNYLGSPLPLPRVGSGQGAKAVTPYFNGAPSVGCGPTNGGYRAVAFPGGAPAVLTVVSVVRVAADTVGWFAITAAGAINSGISQLYQGGEMISRAAGGQMSTVVPLLVPAIMVSVFDPLNNSVRHYINSKTPQNTGVAPIAPAGETLDVCELGDGPYSLDGHWCLTGYASRALSQPECETLLESLGAQYGIAIAP